MHIFCRVGIIASIALLVPVAATVDAHDLRGIAAERTLIEPEAWERIEKFRALRRFLNSESERSRDGELEAVVRLELTWREGRINVCFLDGGREARDHVAEVAQRWTEGTSLQLEFGPAGNRDTCSAARPADVRVTFRGPDYWSLIGTEAKLTTSVSSPTMALGGMDRTTLTPEEDGTILHEFGHAIGFEHEHQSPLSTCEKEFDWDFLYRWGASIRWNQTKVNTNMKELLVPSSKLLTTAFDRESIMLYSLEKESFKDPSTATCYIPKQNTVLSKVDRETAQAVYPPRVSAAPGPEMRAAPPPPKSRDAAVDSALKELKELTQPASR
jgi:hypothetical protein